MPPKGLMHAIVYWEREREKKKKKKSHTTLKSIIIYTFLSSRLEELSLHFMQEIEIFLLLLLLIVVVLQTCNVRVDYSRATKPY